MCKKFACLDFVDSKDEIPIKYSLVKNMPQRHLDWYVYKYNPYKRESISILGAEGYKIKLPMLRQYVWQQPEMARYLIGETVKSLLDTNVDILLAPPKVDMTYLDNISMATGRRLLPFFLVQGISKALTYMGKDIKAAEVLVLGDTNLTLGVVYNIHGEVNFMSVMVDRENIDIYKSATEHILKDTGLNIQVVGRNKPLLGEADIIINTAGIDNSLDFAYKRGSVYFDLGGARENRMELIRKRGDMLIIDDLRIKCGYTVLSTAVVELAVYVKSDGYRSIFSKGYERDTSEEVKSIINELNIELYSFRQLERNAIRSY